MKRKVVHLCKGQASFFLRILVSVMVLSREKRFEKGYLYYKHLYNPLLTVLSCVKPLYLHLSLALN